MKRDRNQVKGTVEVCRQIVSRIIFVGEAGCHLMHYTLREM